jgi:hypothetical protein
MSYTRTIVLGALVTLCATACSSSDRSAPERTPTSASAQTASSPSTPPALGAAAPPTPTPTPVATTRATPDAAPVLEQLDEPMVMSARALGPLSRGQRVTLQALRTRFRGYQVDEEMNDLDGVPEYPVSKGSTRLLLIETDVPKRDVRRVQVLVPGVTIEGSEIAVGASFQDVTAAFGHLESCMGGNEDLGHLVLCRPRTKPFVLLGFAVESDEAYDQEALDGDQRTRLLTAMSACAC